ncbi:hypothetical protein BDF20DRAFT_818001 [Mycotypha africana]|uniref:uncharacterized protein n=1 Tax=Mycotypha africana TaxID=64632 RepID=UPI0023002F78|nr:uncharacterized protein BDF20DRAFT_818001 [Mycotypha africana]KAI8982106.1 hypothetical protein BDF20DRAFT_818001 [Mycotypha africana]
MHTSALILSLFAAMAFVSAKPHGVKTYSSCKKPGTFALTFDDGPYKYSWDLAEYLHKEGIRATFFTNGLNAVDVLHDKIKTKDGKKTYLELLQHHVDMGHEVGSHTYEHKDLEGLSEDKVAEQLDKQSDIIHKAIGKRPRLFRPPEGVYDAVAEKLLKERGYVNVLWDVDTKDWKLKGLKYSQDRVMKALHKKDAKRNGHICLEHDIHKPTVEELIPWLIKYVRDQGYEFVPISECIGEEPYQ